jgi:hypothetical protein
MYWYSSPLQVIVKQYAKPETGRESGFLRAAQTPAPILSAIGEGGVRGVSEHGGKVGREREERFRRRPPPVLAVARYRLCGGA